MTRPTEEAHDFRPVPRRARSARRLRVPASAYYGVHTARALTNFAITGTRIGDYPELIVALAAVIPARCWIQLPSWTHWS
jgi:hypothetical protein